MEVAATASSASAADAADADRSRSRRRGKLSGRCGNSGSRLSAHAAGAEAESEGEVGGETNWCLVGRRRRKKESMER